MKICICGNEIKKGLSGCFAWTCSAKCGHRLHGLKVLWTPKQILTKESAKTLLNKNGKFMGNPLQAYYTIPKEYYWCRTMSDYIWCMLNDIHQQPTCDNPKCQKHTKKYGWHNYRRFCSAKCNHLTQDKAKQEGQKNRKQAFIDKGKWISDSQKSDFYLYKQKVINITNQNKKGLKKTVETGKSGVAGVYQLDHRYSIRQGFEHNILPIYVGHQNNLEYIPWFENNSKGVKCSIDLDTLLSITLLQ